jgi:hypothetical protein
LQLGYESLKPLMYRKAIAIKGNEVVGASLVDV